MSRTYRVRPNPVGSLFGSIIGIGILIFGLNHFGIEEGGGFVLLWVVVLVGTILINLYNAFSERGVATNIVEATGPDHPAVPTPDVASRLRQLADLRREGLITAAEHDRRRTEILRQV